MNELERDYKIAPKLPSEIRLGVYFLDKALIALTILFFILLIILGGYLFDGRQGVWIILSIIAVGLSIIGFFKTLKELAKIEIENAIINICRKQGKEYLESSEREDLNKLFSKLSIENESQPAMNRLIEHIVGEAGMNKFDSGVNLMQPYKDESLDIIFSLQNFQKIALWIGIAGTFIGILKAMNESNFKEILENGKAEEFVEVIPLMFDGLVVSFSASLAGLFSAVVIGCLILIIRKKQQYYFQQMESVINIILASARKCKNKDQYLSEIDFIKDDLKESNKKIFDLEDGNIELQKIISNITQVEHNLTLQNSKIVSSMGSLLTSMEGINSFASKAEEEMRYIHNAASLKTTLDNSIQSASEKLSKAMSDAISDKVLMMTGEMIKFREASVEHLTLFRDSVSQFHNNTNLQNNYFKTSSEENKRTIGSLITNISSLTRTIQSFKLPQSLSTWVIILAVISGLAFGYSLTTGVSYLFSDSNTVENKQSVTEARESTNSKATNIANAVNITKTNANSATNTNRTNTNNNASNYK